MIDTILLERIQKQLSFFCNIGDDSLYSYIDIACQQVEKSFLKVRIWKDMGFNSLNSTQYPIFLYRLSQELFKANKIEIAEAAFYLNKMMHSIDLFYKINLGKEFLLGHALGSVFCNAEYGNYNVFHHNTLIGINNGIAPKIGDGVVMFSGSKVIGNCKLGNNIVLSINTSIVDMNIPDNVYVFPGKGKKPILKDLNEYYADRYFIRDIK